MEEREEKLTERKYLKEERKSRKFIDMEKVYKSLDAGRTVQSVAEEWGVSKTTLYRRHYEYQEYVAIMKRENALPPLPDDMEDSMNKI